LPAALLFPMLLWLAARCPPGFGAAGAFIVSVAVVWTTIFGIGHFGEPSLSISDRLLQAQAIILVVTTGTYVLTALFAERRASAARLANSHMLLERERDSKLLNVEAAVAWIDEIIRRVLDAFREDLAQDSIVMRLDLAPNLPHIEGNVSQLEQVISNLVRNALDAMNATENRPRELHLRTELRGQSAIGIGVQDSGPGIDPTQLSNAFRAFFTTKAHGTGWGWRCAV
jgi:signal transduction histidine kinase